MLKSTTGHDDENSENLSLGDVPVPMCTIDRNGFIISCNDLFAFLFGRSKGELTHISFSEILSEDSNRQFDPLLLQLRICEGIFAQRFWFVKKDGASFHAVIQFGPIRDSEGSFKGANISIQDDTFYYSTLMSVEKDKEEMKRKERLKDEFVAIASHELRTPIQPILGFALLAKRGSISSEAAWEGVLQEARRLQQLANDILDVSRIESNSLRYDFSKFKINELIQHTIESLSSEVNGDVKLDFHYEQAQRDLLIEADRSRMTQVLSNLVGNAIKFTRQGRIEVKSSLIPEKAVFEICISDTGGGISDDIRPKLFEKFATKGHGEGNKKGTGLGLYISKAIVQAHGGTISASNNSEGGATFVITIPVSGRLKWS